MVALEPPIFELLPDRDHWRTVIQDVEGRIPGGGEAPEGELDPDMMYLTAIAVAERLGTQPVVFPGDHGGFGAQPEAFAASLHEVLSR